MPIGDCFRCHQPGHWANHCPLKTSINPHAPPLPSDAAPPPIINQSAPATASLAQTSPAAMPNGDCFHCHQPGHWARNCPRKTSTNPHASPLPADAAPPPVINCPCNGGACKVFTSKTEKNPNRKFYKCPAVPSCGFFKWCDEASIVESKPISDNPPCPCGSGPCRKETVIDGPDANRSYFVCCIKKGFGACEFFQWEDDVDVAQIPSEPEEVGHVNSPCSTSIGFSGFDSADDVNSTRSNQFTLTTNADAVGKEAIPVSYSSNDLESVSNGADGRNQVYEESYELEVVEAMRDLSVTGLSQNTSDLVSNGTNESIISGETSASFSGGEPSLTDLIERYNLDKLHFSSVSTKHVDALTAFTGSYKQLELLRDRAYSLRKQLVEVEKQVKLYEDETSELASNLRRVSGEMVKSQKKMVETAGTVAKEVRVYKQMDFAAP